MNNFLKKYHRVSALLILSAYILFAGVNIFHFHPTKIEFNISFSTRQNLNNTLFNATYYDVNISCQFHSTFSSVHTWPVFVISLENIFHKAFTSYESEKVAVHLDEISRLNPLRAPPAVIS